MESEVVDGVVVLSAHQPTVQAVFHPRAPRFVRFSDAKPSSGVKYRSGLPLDRVPPDRDAHKENSDSQQYDAGPRQKM